MVRCNCNVHLFHCASICMQNPSAPLFVPGAAAGVAAPPPLQMMPYGVEIPNRVFVGGCPYNASIYDSFHDFYKNSCWKFSYLYHALFNCTADDRNGVEQVLQPVWGGQRYQDYN